MIVEHCRFGNLLSYLTAHRHSYINQVSEANNFVYRRVLDGDYVDNKLCMKERNGLMYDTE